ncbi:MAG: YkgJ family cysteine cluster protein [Planctomycetes bacterium]|nr:YkgJ family cysteine cluster protein [Planctomycetota bacterium]
MKKPSKKTWYQSGLAFNCRQCGNCCAGPDEGYVWISKEEIVKLADFLKLTPEKLKKKHLRRVGLRYSLIEKKTSKDCIFLTRNPNQSINCDVYPVRPLQCRTWPFWNENLRSNSTWNHAAQKCPGIDNGLWYDLPKIIALRQGDLSKPTPTLSTDQAAAQWIRENLDNKTCIDAVKNIYQQIEHHLDAAGAQCQSCRQCCDFATYGHRLYASTLEMLYFVHQLPTNNSPNDYPAIKQLNNHRCPYQDDKGCQIYHARTAGCRIFYCRQLDTGFQHELTEMVLKTLKKLHRQSHAVYLYADIGHWLNIIDQTLKPKR